MILPFSRVCPICLVLIQGDANRIQPGKRPLSSMAPTIVLKQQQVYLVLGAAGWFNDHNANSTNSIECN